MNHYTKFAIFGVGSVIVFVGTMLLVDTKDDYEKACYRHGYTRLTGSGCYGHKDANKNNINAKYLMWKEKNDKN